MPTTSDNKLDLLYKKFIGIPLSNPSGAAASEAAGSSKSKIIPSLQIFSQSIPSTAPSDLSNVTFTPTNSGGTKQISSGNIHIAKYTQLGLAEVQPQISYRYANPSVSTNLTSPAIPGNYDVAGSTYAITLYGNDGTTVINPSTYPWVFDTDSGYVSFIDPANLLPTALAPPKITFWRYEGTFGLGTSSGGSSSGAVTGDLSSNGNLFIAYDTSLNSRLVVGSDVTMNKRLFTLGDASLNGNLYVSGNITAQTQSISDNSTKVATTAFVKNVLDASLGNYYTKSVIDASLGNYYTKSVIDASLGNYYTKSVIDASFNEYYTKTYVDSSLNSKATIESPTFTGTAIIPTANITILNTIGDSSMNGNVTIGKDLTINGRLNVQNYTNQNIINTTTTNYQLIISEDLSLNGRLSVIGDSSMNGELYVAGNVTTLTQNIGDSSTKVATTAFVKNVLDASLNDYYTKSVTDSSLNLKASIASPTFTGTATIPTANITTLNTFGDSSMNGNVVIGKDLTINGRLNVQANTIPANAIIGGVSSSSSSGDFTANGNLTVTGNITGNLNAVSNGNVDSINFWTLTKYMNSMINAPPAVTFGNVDTLSTMIRIPWTYPTQYNIGLTDTLIPLIKSLTVTYSITKSGGGGTQTGTIINALTNNSYIKSSLSDPTPITGVVLLKSSGTNGYTTNYTFTDGTRNAYLYWDENIGALTTGDSLTLEVLYTNNNTSMNRAQKPSLNFLAAGTPSAPVYRSSTPGTTSVTIIIGNPQYGDANNPTTNTTITTYSVKYSSTSNATRYGGVKSSGLITANTTVSVTPTGTANVSANTTNSITSNIYPETTYTANITAVNNVNTSVGTYSGNFTFTTTPFTIPTTAWSTGTTLSFSGLSTASNMLFGNNTSATSLILSVASAPYTTSSMTTIINDFERRGVNGNGNTTTISANVVLNGSVTNGPSISVDANIGNSSVPGSNAANSITITPTAIADNYVGNSIGYDGYYKKYTGTVSLASGLFTPSPYQYTVNLSRTSGNVSANAISSYSFYYDTITGNPGTPSISSFTINTTSYSPVCGIYVINGNSNATFTASFSVSNLGQYFYKSTPVTYSSTGTIGTIISANETTIPSGNVYGNLLIYNPVNFTSKTITSSSLTSVFTTTIPLTITASNYNGNTANTATSISAIIDGPSVALITSSISTLSTISNTSSYKGARYFAGSSPDSITSNNNSVSSLFSNASNSGAYNHSTDITTGTYGKELQIANGSFVTKASSYGYKDYSSLKYSSSLTNSLNYSSISSSSVYRYACFAWKITAYSNYNYITFTMNNPSGFNRSGSSGFQPLTTNSSSLGATTEIPFYYKVEDSANSGGLNTYWIKGNNNTGVQINNNVIGDTAQSATLYNGIPSSGYSTDTSSFKVIFPAPLAGNYNSNTYLYCIIGLPMDANCYFNYMSAQIS